MHGTALTPFLIQNRVYQIAATDEVELVDWLRALERVGCPITHTKTARSNSIFYQSGGPENEEEDSEPESADEAAALLEAQVSGACFAMHTHTHTRLL
jgi:hypothetical protein